MDRLYGLRQVTRLQKAQIDAEMAKAEVRVEQSLSEYVASSQALSLLIGDSSVVGGAAIYLPVDYADDLAQAVPVTFEDALATAQATRPDFKINDINALLREIDEAQARTNARPDLRISASATSSQAGTTYGYADPLTSHTKVATPDKIDQNYGLTFTMPWANRAAYADADKAELGLKDQEYATDLAPEPGAPRNHRAAGGGAGGAFAPEKRQRRSGQHGGGRRQPGAPADARRVPHPKTN